MIQQPTFMNDIQIKKARDEGELVICPYAARNLTPVGYNLSFSRFIISLRRKAFIKIIHKNKEWFFMLKPFDTALVLTRETIWVSKFIGGTFHSKVSMVIEGLGHVSTTLDPGWYGQLLVPISNPTKKSTKIVIAKDEESGIVFQTFITMVLFRSQEAALNLNNDNKSGRIELLEQILESKKSNADARYLLEFIQNLKKNINQMETFDDLNDPVDRQQKIIRFQQEHLKLIDEMDKEFEIINKFSKKGHNRRTGCFIGIVAATIFILCAIYMIADKIFGETHREIVNGFTTVILPFVVFGLGYVRDKYFF